MNNTLDKLQGFENVIGYINHNGKIKEVRFKEAKVDNLPFLVIGIQDNGRNSIIKR